MCHKVLIIGLDDADWRGLRPWLEDGTMPNLACLLEQGVLDTCESTR